MNQRGFTLLEILIATVLVVIVIGAVYGSLSMAERVIPGRGESLERLTEARRFLDVLSYEIESSFMLKKDDSTGIYLIPADVEGKTGSEIELTTLWGAENIPRRVRYKLTKTDGLLAIEKTITDYGGKDRPYSLMALEGVSGFRITVMNKGTEAPSWDSTKEGRLPELVQIELTLNLNERDIYLKRKVIPRIGL